RRGKGGRPRDQRHLRPDPGQDHRHGLRRSRPCSARDRALRGRPRQGRGGPRGAAAVLPAAENLTGRDPRPRPPAAPDSARRHMDPKTLRYSTTHEWASLQGDTCTIGITKFAVEQLGDIVYVELPDAGDHVFKEKDFGEIESVKAVSPLVSPIDGEVTA